MNKKAQSLDLLYIMIGFVIVCICVLVATKIMDDLAVPLQDAFNQTEADNIVSTRQSSFASLWDNVLFGLIILLIIAMIVGASLIPATPAFLVMGLLIWIVFTGITAIGANVFAGIATHSSFQGIATASATGADPTMIFIPHIMQNLVLIIGGAGLLFNVIIFARIRKGGQ